MLKPLDSGYPPDISLCARLLDSDAVHALRLIKPRPLWWAVPAIAITAGLAGWIATIPLN